MRRSPSVILSLSSVSVLILFVLTLSAVTFAAPPDRITGPIDVRQTTALPRSLHPRAQAQYDRGLVDPSREFGYLTLLTSPSASQQEALDQLLVEQQDPKSPNYHKWLSPQQYADRFGLSVNDFTKIATWLTSQGFQILSAGGGRNSIAFSGTAAQVHSAFGAEIHNYQIDGKEYFANSTPLMVPSALSGIVSCVIGLNSFLPHPTIRGRAPNGIQGPRANYYDGNYVFPNYLAPGDIATIYDINSLYDAATPINGASQTLAVIGQTDIYLADINDFRSSTLGFNLPAISGCTTNGSGIVTACNSTYFKYVAVGTDPGENYSCGDLGEADLDIEWSGGTARNAQIVFVNSPVVYDVNCNYVSGGGVYTALSSAINPPSGPPLGTVVTMSYGYCEAGAPDLETVLQQGNAEGVTILNSAGDVGSTACDYNPPNSTQPFLGAQYGYAVSYPASSPEVTGVGGTSISLANDSYPNPSSYWDTTIGANGGTAVSYIPELPWNDNETWADYCHSPYPGDPFCSQGTSQGVPGWVPLGTSATASQVQSDIWIYMGGGGASNCWYENQQTGVCLGAGAGPTGGGFPQPAYQQGLSVPGAPAGVRYVPDVSLLASPTFPGYIFCTPLSELGGTGSTSSCANGIFDAVDTYFSVVGGTSVSTPVFAGLIALLNQDVVQSGLQSAPGLGNVNTVLYNLAAHYPNAFHQVKTGDNMVSCQKTLPTGYPTNIVCPNTGVVGYEASNADAATGYNLVTGLGSVDAYNLATAWIASQTPSFTLAASPTSVSIAAGGAGGTSTITVTPVNGFTGNVTLSASGLPTGVTAAFGTNPTTSTSVLTLTASASAAAGTTTVTISGTSGSLTETTTISLTVTSTPTFALSASPGSVTIIPTQAGGTSTITVTDEDGFSGSVTLSASGLPTGVTAAFGTNPTTSTSVVTLTAGASATLGTATVTIKGTSGSITATTTISLTVDQDFSVPPTLTAPPSPSSGQSTSTTMQISSVGGAAFNGNVTYTCSAGLPAGISACSFSPPQIASGASSPQTVTITVPTLGPFTGVAGGARRGSIDRKTASQKERLWLPLSMPLAGMLLVGLAGRGLPRRYTIVGLCLALALAGLLVACGGGSSGSPPAVVSVSPATVNTLYPSLTGAPAQTQQFSASVSNSTSQTVTWAVSGTGNGTIDQTGLYTAPATLPNPNSAIAISATSTATSSPGTATVNLQTPTAAGMYPVTVTITEGSVTHTTTFSLVVAN
ncbi:MAG: protease pro-enzyme activation domain-containing protein [Terriglobales bacterium]